MSGNVLICGSIYAKRQKRKGADNIPPPIGLLMARFTFGLGYILSVNSKEKGKRI